MAVTQPGGASKNTRKGAGMAIQPLAVRVSVRVIVMTSLAGCAVTRSPLLCNWCDLLLCQSRRGPPGLGPGPAAAGLG